MMTILSNWLGFETKQGEEQINMIPTSTTTTITPNENIDNNLSIVTTITPTKKSSQPGIVINSNHQSNTNFSQSSSTLHKTKSDELLRDFEVMRFLSHVDQRLKQDRALISQSDFDRLQTLHSQAASDNNHLLTDIVEHFEAEYEKLRLSLQSGGPSSAAADVLGISSSPHMVVY